jgi:hypothetical protein
MSPWCDVTKFDRVSDDRRGESVNSGSIAVDRNIHLRITLEVTGPSVTTFGGVPPAHSFQQGSVEIADTFNESQRAAATIDS